MGIYPTILMTINILMTPMIFPSISSHGNIMGISREYLLNIMGISWECHQNTGIFMGPIMEHIIGISWDFFNQHCLICLKMEIQQLAA